MRPLYFLGWWLLRHFRDRRGFGNRRAVSSGGVGQLYAQGRERQGLATSVVRHFDNVSRASWMRVRCARYGGFLRKLFAAAVVM